MKENEKELESKDNEKLLGTEENKKTDSGSHKRYGSGGVGMPFVEKHLKDKKDDKKVVDDGKG